MMIYAIKQKGKEAFLNGILKNIYVYLREKMKNF